MRSHRLSILTLILGALCWALAPSAAAQYPSWPVFGAQTATGQEFHSSELQGKVVVMSVWASWCNNCRKQVGVLSKLQRLYGESGVQVVGFSIDRQEEDHRQFVRQERLTYPAIFARNGRGLDAVKTLQVKAGSLEAVPTLLVFDRQGNLVHRSVGFATMGQLEDLVSPLLK